MARELVSGSAKHAGSGYLAYVFFSNLHSLVAHELSGSVTVHETGLGLEVLGLLLVLGDAGLVHVNGLRVSGFGRHYASVVVVEEVVKEVAEGVTGRIVVLSDVE